MALMWGLGVPLPPAYLSLMLLSFLVCGIWVLFSRYQSQTQVAAKTEASKQHNLKQIQRLTVSQLEEARMNIIKADVTCISELPAGWTQEYVFWSIDRSLRQIFQHLENARSTLMELSLLESRDVSCSSVSDIVVQEVVPPCCYCKKGKHSPDHSESSGSSDNSSSLSYLPIFSEGAAVPASSQKEPAMHKSHSASLPTFQLTDPESDLLPNLAVLPPLRAQSSFINSILESLDSCDQEKKKDKRKNRLLSDHGLNSVLNENSGPLVWAPLQISPLVRGELEGHMSQKVSTLREQVVPLPVKKSWEILNRLMDVQGVPEQELPQTQLPTFIPQRAEQNANRSLDVPSFHLHVNIGMNSELSRTEAKMSHPFTSNKQLQSEGDRQVIRYNPLVISMGTPSPRNLGVNIIQEETALLKRDPKHVLELSIEQRVIALPEKRVQSHKAQVTNVELTPKVPCSVTDSLKVTPLALLQVMDSMGIIPESHLEVMDSVGFSPQPPNQAKTVSITPQPSDQVIESIKGTSLQHQTMESKSVVSRQNQVTDNTKVTPVALFQVMDSMGMINELNAHEESVEIAPKPQYQVMKPVKMDTLHNHQAIGPGNMSLGAQHTVMETLNTTLGSQNQVTKHIGITPSPIHQNTVTIHSTAQQTMDFVQLIPPGQSHITESRALIQGSQPQVENLTPVSAQPDVLTSTVPVGAVESRHVPSQLPSKVLEPSGVILLPSGQSLHALKVTPIVQVLPTGMITPLHVVEPPALISQPVAQIKESLELPSGLQVQVGDSMGMTAQHQGTEYVSLTPGLSHQVMDPLKFTPWHQDLNYSEKNPRQNHIMTGPMGLTSDTWPQVKGPIEVTQSHHQVMESMRTIPAPPDQGTAPIGRSQKHEITEAEIVPIIPLLQEMEYLGENTIPQPEVMDSMNLPLELQNVKTKHLIPDPRLQSMKSVDITADLVSEKVKYGPQTSTVVSADLVPELHQQNMQSEELTPMPPLQSEKSVPSLPPSQLQDVKSSQLTVGPQLQNIQSSGLAPDPQLQSSKPIHLTPGSQSESMEDVHSALPQELPGDIKMVELTPRPSPEDTKPVNLASKPCLQNTSSDKIAHVPLLEETNTPMVEGRSLIPEALGESGKVGELIPSTHLYEVKSLEVSPDPSYHFPEPEGLALQHQASEARATSDICYQVEESVELTQLSLEMTLAPLSQTSESMEMSSPPLQDILETRTQVVKKREDILESQNTIKGTLDLLPESEVQNLNSKSEPQPPDVKFVHVTLEPCSEVTNQSEITLRSEYEDTNTIRLTLPKVDDTQGTIVKPFTEMGSLGLSLEPGLQGEKSDSLADLKSAEVIAEPSVLVVDPTELTTGPKPHIQDVIPGPLLHQIESRQMDTESQLQNEKSVNVIQQSSIGMVDPEKTKLEPGLQSLSPKELIEGTQPPSVKSVDLNLGPQKLSVKSGLIPGPQLQSVRFPNFYEGLLLQGENPVNFISAPPHYGVKSDEAISCSPVPEIKSSDFILGPKVPESQPQSRHMKSVEVNVGPCLQNVRFSDQIPETKHQGFKHIQFIPSIQLQDRTSQAFVPETFSPLSQESRLEDMKLALPMEVSEFRPTSDPQYPSVIPQEVNPGLWQQDVKFSELASGPKLQEVKFGEQTPGSLFHDTSSMTPEVGIHDPNLAKMTPESQDTRQASFNSGPWLQDVKFFDAMPGTQPQGVKTSELNLGPQLECVKIFEMTTQPERQGMRPELIVQESLFRDTKYVTGNQIPSFEEEMSYKLASDPQIPNAESVTSSPGIHLASVDHSELIRRPQAQGIESYELIHKPNLEYIKTVEKTTVSKQEELTPGPHLGDVKSKELQSKSELGKVKSMLSTPGIQAGHKELEEQPPGSNSEGLISELLPSRSQLEDRKSGVLTLGQCLERIKSTVVSPSSSQPDGIKSVKLIPGSRIQDLKTVGLAHDTWVQDVNAMGLRLEPKKQGESPVTFVPGMLFQDNSMELLQGSQLQGIKPKEPTSQPQTQDKKRVIISCLKPQSLKPVNMPKTQEIQFVDLVSTQQCQGMAPMDLTLEPGQDDGITVNSSEWKVGVFDQLKKQCESEDVLSIESDQEPKPADIKPIEINSKVPFKDTPSFELAPEPVVPNVKAKVFQYESQMQQVKAVEPTSESPLQDVKTMALKTESQTGSTKSVQWIPISEFQNGKYIGSNLRFRSQSARPTELKPSTQWRGVRSSDLTARSKIQGEKSVGFHPDPQSQLVKTSPLTVLGLQKTKTCNLTSEPQPQGTKTMELNKEPQVESVRSIRRLPGPEFHRVKFLGLNCESPSQGVKSTEQKPSIQLGGVKPSEMTPRPKVQGKKSVDFNLGPQIQYIKTPEACPEPQLQKGENFASTSEPQLQGLKTVELNRDPQVGRLRSIQWLPGPEFHGVKFLGLNCGSLSQGVKSTERKPSIQLGGVKPPEMTLGPKPQGKKSVDFNLGPQVQYIKTPEVSAEPELQEEENVASASELQSQCVKSVASHHRPQLENTKSVQWIPVSDCQVKKSMLNLKGLQSQDVTAKELKPLVQLRDSKTSDELTTKPKFQGKQPSGSTQEHQPQRFKIIDSKSELQFKNMKACDPKLRPKVSNTKPTFKPRFHLEDTSSPGVNPGIQSQEVKLLGTPPGTQPQAVTSLVFKQESQSSEVKFGVLSQGPYSQNDLELKSAKSSELAFQTKPGGMKSEVNSGPQWQSAKCSDLTPETESQNMKCTKSSPSSQLKGKPFTELAIGTKIRSVKLDCKLGPQWQGIKPNSILRTKPQDTEMEDCESGPQLQDLKSSRTIMGIKVQDVKSVDFSPGPHLKDMTSEVITEKRVHGMKSAEIKPPSKLQGKNPEFTPRKMFLGTKSVDLDSGPPLQDLKYPELIMSVKLQDVNSMGHVPSIKSSGIVTQIKPQGIKAINFNSGPQTQNKKPSELDQGKRLHDMGPIEFSQSPKIQGMTVESKPPNEESVTLNSGPQLQDENYSKSTLGTVLQDGRSMKVSPGPGLQGMKPSEVISEDRLQKEKPMGFVDQPLRQDVKSSKCTFWKRLDKKPLQLELPPQSQNRKLPMLTPESHLQGMKPEAINAGSELKGGKAEPTNVQTMKNMGLNHGAESQVVGFSEQASDSTVYSEGSSELNARNHKQDGKPHKLSQKQQLQSVQPIVFSHEPHLQHIKSSELYRKLKDLKSMEFNSEQQLQDVKSSDLGLGTGMQSLEFNPAPQWQEIKPSEVCPETKLLDESSLKFKHEPRLQGRASCGPGPGSQIHCKNVIESNTRTQNVEASELHPCPDLQGIKSKVLCFGPHLEGVNSAWTPNANSQYVDSSGCKPGPYLQDMNSSACIPEPGSQCINPSCNPEPHLHGMNSACILGPKLQGVDSTGCIHEPNFQDVNSSVCTPGPSPQCVNSSACTPEPSPPCVNSTECNPKAHLQGVNQWAPIIGPQIQCVDSTECIPASHLQGVCSSVCTPGQNPQCEHSNSYNPGPFLQGTNSCTTFPAPQIMCVNTVWCNTQTHFQDVNNSARTTRQESQPVNSTGYNRGQHLQAPNLQGMKFSELNPKTGLQREMPIIVNPRQQLQYLKPELTPVSNITGIAPVGYNPGPQVQCVNFSEVTLGLKSQHTSSMKPSSGSQLESTKSFELTSASESQCQKSVLLSSGPPFQGGKSSNLVEGAKFQEIPFLKNQLRSGQQTSQPMFASRPQSNGVKYVGVLPAPLSEDRMSSEMSKQPLLCTNSVKLSPGFGLQDLRSKEFSPEPCFQNVKSVQSKPGSQSQSVKSSEFTQGHSSQYAKSSFAPKPCFQYTKSMPVRLGSQQQVMNCQQFPLDKKPMVSTPESTRKFLAGPALTSVKFSNLIPESQQCMKSTEFTSEQKWQSVKHVKLSSVSLPQAGNSVWLSPRPFPQNVTSGNQIPQTSNQITESPKVICRPGHQLVEYAEISQKIRHQVPKLVNYPDMGSSEMTKGLGHKSTETVKKSMRLTPKPIDKAIDSLGVPQQLDLPVPAFVDVTPTPSDQDSNSSELNPQKSYPIPETLELLSCSWPQFKDFKELQTKQVTGSDRMTLEFKNHFAEIMKQICETRQGKEFLRVTSKPVDRETECAEKFPRPCPQDLGPVVVSSEKRSQREGSVVCPPRQSGEEAGRVIKAQHANMENANITPIESLEKIIDFVRISPKSPDQVTESAKIHPQGPLSEAPPKVSESVTVIPGPPLQVIKSVMIPEPTSQVSKCADSTPKLHDVIFSEFSPRLWLQNVESKKLIAEPTHQILETIDLLGFQVIKTILVPKPLLLMVKSEELAPGPSPQAIETIGVATRSSIKVKDCLSLFPRPHLQDMVKPLERTPRANIQGNSAELILQQTSSLEEPLVLTHKQRLQAEKFLGIKTESPKDMDIEDLTQGRVSQKTDSEMITSEKLQAENYFSRLIHSPSIPFISSSVKTTELASLQGSGMPEVSRALAMKNFGVGILQSPESYTDTIMIRSSALPLVLPPDKTGNTVRTLYPKIWEMDVISKEGIEKKQMEEFGDSLQSYSPYPLRLLPSEFQAGLGARRNPIRSFLGRQQNVWESHVCRQRLPRKYLSNMLMLGNVLGTTMERKLCSPQFLTEGTTMDIGRTIQNLFGVPAELMEFSQSLIERGPRTISQTSVFKNYIQRHILCHGNEKRMPLKMWTRGSTSSIIQQYSGTRLGIKKTNSKLSDIFQEVTQQVSVSCPGAQFPALGKSESPLGILYNREDPVSREQSKNSQIDSPTRTLESHHSLKANYLSRAKTDISEQLHLLKDLQLKIAAKLLRSQIPHNVPPPLASGLVLKYPICLQCGRCSGFNCCHKLQSAFGPYLLIYPQIHLLSTPEGHGEIRLHLGFRLRTGKRPQVSKYRGRNRADAWKSTAPPSRRKTKVYTPASKSPTSTRDFQSRSPQSPASVQVHVRQKQWGSHGVVGKTEAKDSGYYEFCQVHSLSESGFESNQDEKWVTSSLRKTSDLKYPVKKITHKTQNTKLYKNSRTLEESPSGTLTDPSRSKSIDTAPTSTISSKRQPKKSSQPKFIQLLFQGLRQAFQTAHRMLAITGRKSEDRTRSDNLWSSKNLHYKQKAKDYCLTEDDKGASTPVVKPRSTGSTPKQEDRLQETHDQCRQAQRPKQVSSSQPKPLQLQKTMVSDRDVIIQPTSITEPLRVLENVNGKAKNYSAEICGLESNVGAKFLAEESVAPDSLLTSTLQRQFKETHTQKKEHHGFFGERALPSKPSERTYHGLSGRTHHRSISERRHRSPSQKKHSSPSDRTLRSLSERSHRSPSQRKDRSPFVRTPQSFSDRSHHNFFKGKGRSPSGRSRSPSGRSRPNNLSGRRPARSSRSPRERRVHTPSPKGRLSLSGRSQHSPSSQRGRSPSKRSQLSPIQRTRGSPSERSHGSLSERSPSSPFGRKRYISSGRIYHSHPKSRPHRRRHRSHSERTHYSPSESRNSHHSGRSQHGQSNRPHHRPRERLKLNPSKERITYNLSKELKNYLSMSPGDYTQRPPNWTSLEA